MCSCDKEPVQSMTRSRSKGRNGMKTCKLKSLERMIRECSLRWMLRQARMRMDRRTPGTQC
ncbi:hypothetical protein HanLR1_Chr03g0112611 [Helianthus annuus]|nr:hypothetical protein HanLR1_Chr03g0112611 [Helianthus annuus]